MNRQADILSGPVEERLTQANAILDERFQDKDESGYRLYNGERIHFQIVTAAANQDLVSYLQRQLQKIGIEVTLQAAGSTPETTYLYNSNFDMTVRRCFDPWQMQMSCISAFCDDRAFIQLRKNTG